MTSKRIWLTGLMLVAVAGAAVAGIRSYRTRTRPLCGIPTRDYQYMPRSDSVIVASMIRMTIPKVADETNPAKQKNMAIYQLDKAKLTIDHCSISRTMLQIHDNGVWVMSLRGDQNPPEEDGTQPATTDGGKYTAHLKRNQFVVKVRCYGAYQRKESSGEATAARPMLFEIEPITFWVQKGRPYTLRREGMIRCQPELLKMVDRVELEFYYR